MHVLLCTAGDEAVLQATRNLGQYVAHVIGNPQLVLKLADPAKAHHAESGFLDALLSVYGPTLTKGNPVSGAVLQRMNEDTAKQASVEQVQHENWSRAMTRDYSDILAGTVFDELDKLVNVL